MADQDPLAGFQPPPPPTAADDPLAGWTGTTAAPPPDPPPQKSILDTSYKKLPSAAGDGSLWDAPARISTAMSDAYHQTPDLLTPPARQAVSNLGWLGRNVLGPAVDAGSFAVKEGSALGEGGMAALSELLSGGNAQLARDVHAGLQVAPVAHAMTPGLTSLLPVDRGPRFTGDLPPTDMPPPTPGGPTSPATPPTAVPIRTPADARGVVDALYKSADTSGARVAPQFTHDWVASLDDYDKQTAAGKAAGGDNSVATLVAQLKNTADAPMDSLKSIQEVDQTIQSAMAKEYGPNGLSPEGRQMRQMLQDFRQRYENIPADQISGGAQGIEDFTNARKGYAAYSRMRDLQGVVDSTEGNPNRATLIASRTNAFLNDPDNVRGWNPDEIAAARKAANSGFLQEWMRAEGSRLVGIGSAVTGGLPGQLFAVPAQVGLSYLVRNAAENMRIRRLQDAIGVLGQRVPQPGTVPPQPPPFVPPQASVSAARYAPLVGLLGQSLDQQTNQ